MGCGRDPIMVLPTPSLSAACKETCEPLFIYSGARGRLSTKPASSKWPVGQGHLLVSWRCSLVQGRQNPEHGRAHKHTHTHIPFFSALVSYGRELSLSLDHSLIKEKGNPHVISNSPRSLAWGAEPRWLVPLYILLPAKWFALIFKQRGPSEPPNTFSQALFPSIFLTSYYHGGNLIHMFLVHLHLTHPNVVLEERFDVKEASWASFIHVFSLNQEFKVCQKKQKATL